ncbi:hypothetical protein [Winogradskyella sp. A2]|uniref:hypothetical protein n=1 Tax=Winogradskyella sp. A2 TaxID=3366944 RepID=UPI00398C822E
MEIKEICNNCYKDYTPKRRGVQKFCSNSCRSRHWQKKQGTKTLIKQENNNTSTSTEKKESISLAGVGNAALGTFTVDTISNLLTHPDNKPATKGDIKKLIALVKGDHYFRVKNVRPNVFGHYPYYDLETESVVFLKI